MGEWYGVSADSLGRITALDLTRNGLAGELPADLGDLAWMTELRIGGNALSGRLPVSLKQLPLLRFHYAGTDLCVPTYDSFRAWLAAIPSHDGTDIECAPLSDREILEVLYHGTAGANWTNNDNWLTEMPLKEWHGVRIDGLGHVVELHLGVNALTGTIPPALGNLPNMTLLNLGTNNLSGSIPPELGNLANLEFLFLDQNELTGAIPPELGDLVNLEFLFLYQNELTGPIPRTLGNLAKLTRLSLNRNRLTGSIPPELGRLAKLTHLALQANRLTGPIPGELGNLANLRELGLLENQLTGSIPSELGKLANLSRLWVGTNRLTGPIPPELGSLTNLTVLQLKENQLAGSIPPQLGELLSLTDLRLYENRLTGPIPPELGSLANLERLQLDGNDLTGEIPREFGALLRMRHLGVARNARMAGALPTDLTALRRLEALLTAGTGLCAPSDPGFQKWLEGLRDRRVASCTERDLPVAYLTQAAQSRAFPVPLVAGEEALLRVFPTASQPTETSIPLVRARFYRDGRQIHVEDVPGKSVPIPTKVDEGSLSNSANAAIPGDVVQPGLEMVIEVDPDETLDPALGVVKRIPETGRLAVEVRAVPLLDLTLIPFIWTESRDSSAVDLVEAITADPEHHEMLRETRTLLPVADLKVTAHEPVLTSTNNAYALSTQVRAIRAMEAGPGHYAGLMPSPLTGALGLGSLGGRVSVQVPSPVALAHELGHNLSLPHPACAYGGATDPSFPYDDGSIGVWGYDARNGGSLVAPSTRDLMSGCIGGPPWISDYNFTKALRFRLFDEGRPETVSPSTRSLLLWGGVGADGVPYLEPVFVVEAPAALVDSAGDYRLVGRSRAGAELFSLSFAMPQVSDGEGQSSFAYVLPIRAGWEGNLASITLSGPGGAVTLDAETDQPMVILRNPRTGQVRGFLRDSSPGTPATAYTAGTGIGNRLELLFSRGLPDAPGEHR